MKKTVLFICLLFVGMPGLGQGANKTKLVVFYAPCYSPVLSKLKDDIEKTFGVSLRTEVKGSQVLCRQVAELGRECDLMLLADAELFKTLAAGKVSWRMEFAHDEVVLGVGIRAQRTDEAEKDWTTVLQDPKIVLGRVDERMGPIGYRTLLVWKLKEKEGYQGLYETFIAKPSKLMDQADHLAALLTAGAVDYGFLYKTTCLQNDIRFISLKPEINLGAENVDYSQTEVAYSISKNGQTKQITVKGSVVTYGMSIPDNAAQPELAMKIIEYLVTKHGKDFEEKGYMLFKPTFYGTKQAYEKMKHVSDYSGEF